MVVANDGVCTNKVTKRLDRSYKRKDRASAGDKSDEAEEINR